MNKVLFYATILVLLIAIYGAINLSITDFQKKNVCPKILNIPACYIVLFFFIMVLVSHLVSPSSVWYFAMLAVPLFLALSGSLTEMSGKVICPRTPGGTPMCFISLGICSLLLIMKIAENKL